MAMNKGLVIGCSAAVLLALSCACGGGALLYFGWTFTSAIPRAADDFLGLLGQGKLTEAYDSAASGLRAQQTPDDFAAEVKRLGLTEYASSSWNNINFVNAQGTVQGTITTKTGGTIPLKIELVNEAGVWRVLSLSGPPAKVGAEAEKKIVPPDDDLRKLVKKTLVDVSNALKTKDFTAFHGTVSTLWQSQKTPAELQQIFQVFIDKQIDLSAVKDLEPVFDTKPARDDKGKLLLSGYFATTPQPVHFELTYAYEHPQWKLEAIKLRMGQ